MERAVRLSRKARVMSSVVRVLPAAGRIWTPRRQHGRGAGEQALPGGALGEDEVDPVELPRPAEQLLGGGDVHDEEVGEGAAGVLVLGVQRAGQLDPLLDTLRPHHERVPDPEPQLGRRSRGQHAGAGTGEQGAESTAARSRPEPSAVPLR